MRKRATADLAKLIDLIYAGALTLEAWPGALNEIADALQASAMSLTIAHPSGRSAPIVVAPRSDPEWLRVYSERWAASNIVRERGTSLPAGAVYGFEDLGISRAEFERTEFYNEFWNPQRLNHALVMMTANQAEAISAVGFYRSRADGPFEAAAERLLRNLGPHLQRAVLLNLRLGQAELRRDNLISMLDGVGHGAFLVDARGRVLFANQPAEELLIEGSALCLRDGALATPAASTSAALATLIAGGFGGGLGVSGIDGETLELEVTPLPPKTQWSMERPTAFVLVRAPKAAALPSAEQIRDLLNCTRAQALLARELLLGDGIPAAAARIGISRSTARTHLLGLFQKTGANRQAELVRLILQRLPSGEMADADPALKPLPANGRGSWRDFPTGGAMMLTVGSGLLQAIAC